MLRVGALSWFLLHPQCLEFNKPLLNGYMNFSKDRGAGDTGDRGQAVISKGKTSW